MVSAPAPGSILIFILHTIQHYSRSPWPWGSVASSHLIAHDLSSLYFNKICKLIGMRWLELVLQYMVIVPCTLESKHRTIYTEYEYRVHYEGKHPSDLPDHLTWLLRNLYAGQEATVRTGHETMDLFKTGKGVHQGCILSPCLFNLHAEYIIWNISLDDSQAGIKIVGENINNLRYADDTSLMTGGIKELLEGERGEWFKWLKTRHSKH